MLGDLLSLLVGIMVIIISVAVMMAFPKNKRSDNEATNTLQKAIYISFMAAGLNSVFWQFGNQLLVELFQVISVHNYREVGNWMDLWVKGIIVFAGWLHLKALWLSLGDKEKKVWRVWEMPFYPRKIFRNFNICKRMRDG